MTDGETLFLRKLALSVGRLDFWNLASELSPYEIAVHYAAQQLEPVGDERADLRSALQTLSLIQSQRTQPMTTEEIDKIYTALMRYLPIHKEAEKTVSPDEAAKQGKAAFARIGK